MRALLLLVLLAGCGDSGFRKVEELRGFRVLGVIATAPEVAPGGSSTLQLVVSDPEGGGRTISGTTVSCVDPGIALGASVSCAHDPTAVTGTYTIDTVNDADLGAADLYTGLATQTVTLTVPDLLQNRSTKDRTNGVGYITIFTFSVDGKTVSAFKRVLVSNRSTLNTNPAITDVTLEGATLSAKPRKDERLKIATSAPETYNFVNDDGAEETRAEELAVAWFVSEGELDKPKSEVGDEVKYLTDPPSSPLVVLALVRDDRGGMTLSKTVLP